MVGCLGNLYDSVETLNDTYLQSKQIKNTLLNPKVSSCGSTMLLPSVEASTAATTFYGCSYAGYGNCRVYVSDGPNATCPQCKQKMAQVNTYVQPPSGSIQGVGDQGGYVKDVVTYMVMDDLTVKPMSTISSITLLNKFNIKEVGALEEKIITMDFNQGVKLLKASLQSKTVLTDVFLKKYRTL
ncbi:uncharacterized protein LOC111010168 [Momordica charantia]|uniref:Uncharacterized protein LOC111010168 n=1 Tax=Momordica charantia TaxID=3673 RepID=A0A6J1CC90_MOMCH|nr:uncharacterized protein LOC111010168 [Momordica charantia]